MIDYEKMKQECEKSLKLTDDLINGFIIPYGLDKDRIDRELKMRLGPYKHIVQKMPVEWNEIAGEQYIAHRILKNGGLLNKYLKHSALKRLTKDERQYLEQFTKYPWKFSFSKPVLNPHVDFYLMMDAFTDETYLLFSPGITNTLKEHYVSLWLNLIYYNGTCWQSFGPISPFLSFDPDDIFFFTTELNPDIETEEGLLANLEANPVPYMMLLSGANHPVVMHKKDKVVRITSEFNFNKINAPALKDNFKIEFAEGIYRFILKRWGGFPHFAEVYFDENEELLVLFAMTDRGYARLVGHLNGHGFDLPPEPDIRVKPAMLRTAGHILRKEIKLNMYEHLFDEETPAPGEDPLHNLNDFLFMYLEDFNAGKQPDIEKLAKQAQVDPENAKSIIREVMGTIDKMK